MSASLILLSGCATTSESAYAPSNKAYSETRILNDELYMAHVEAIARRRGIDLTWVNPPKKRIEKDE